MPRPFCAPSVVTCPLHGSHRVSIVWRVQKVEKRPRTLRNEKKSDTHTTEGRRKAASKKRRRRQQASHRTKCHGKRSCTCFEFTNSTCQPSDGRLKNSSSLPRRSCVENLICPYVPSSGQPRHSPHPWSVCCPRARGNKLTNSVRKFDVGREHGRVSDLGGSAHNNTSKRPSAFRQS